LFKIERKREKTPRFDFKISVSEFGKKLDWILIGNPSSQYSSHFTPNHSDDEGRYDLANQGRIGLWNLDKLGRALKPLLTTTERQKSLEVILSGYSRRYQEQRLRLFRQKLGLGDQPPQPGNQILMQYRKLLMIIPVFRIRLDP
jgi:hypothetical protein